MVDIWAAAGVVEIGRRGSVFLCGAHLSPYRPSPRVHTLRGGEHVTSNHEWDPSKPRARLHTLLVSLVSNSTTKGIALFLTV